MNDDIEKRKECIYKEADELKNKIFAIDSNVVIPVLREDKYQIFNTRLPGHAYVDICFGCLQDIHEGYRFMSLEGQRITLCSRFFFFLFFLIERLDVTTFSQKSHFLKIYHYVLTFQYWNPVLQFF
jgi:hypothetical protein